MGVNIILNGLMMVIFKDFLGLEIGGGLGDDFDFGVFGDEGGDGGFDSDSDDDDDF